MRLRRERPASAVGALGRGLGGGVAHRGARSTGQRGAARGGSPVGVVFAGPPGFVKTPPPQKKKNEFPPNKWRCVTLMDLESPSVGCIFKD